MSYVKIGVAGPVGSGKTALIEALSRKMAKDFLTKAPGTNGCDFVEIMQALKDINYDGYITMENGFESRSSHPFVVARQSLENLKAIENSLK